MSGITAGALRISGGIGIGSIVSFFMCEYPGEHSRATITGIAQPGKDGQTGCVENLANAPVEVLAEGEDLPLYSGILQSIEEKEENGLRMIQLELVSGSILLGMEKKSRSYQNTGQTYGEVVSQALASQNTAAVYPDSLDGASIGFPVIQYYETDWEFVKRIASRFALSLFPEPSMGGAKVYLGVPKTGNACEIDPLEYTARVDKRFYVLGGEKAGYDRSQFLCYEVKSLDNCRVGDLAEFKGEQKYICAKSCTLNRGQAEFTYTLASPEWAGAKEIGNRNFSGLSLLGTVESCSNETVCLKLDIDKGNPEQTLYAWNWVPPTGNLMYMMPQAGTRVSLYFKGDQETSAVAVNCIRSGCGCENSDYRDKGLITEHDMELRLYQGEMGLATKNGNNLLLNNGKGIELTGTQDFKIMAAGNIRLEGKNIRLEGPGGVNSYQGFLQVKEAGGGTGAAQVMAKNVPLVGNGGGQGAAGASEAEEPEMELEVIIEAKVELLEGDEGQEADTRGLQKTYYLAWEHEDLKHPSNRYRDMPEEQGRDWAGLVNNVIGGIALTAGAAALAYAAPYALAGTKIGAVVLKGLSAAQAGQKLGAAVFLAGSMSVIGLGVSDFMSNRVSSREEYLRRAMAGAISGFLSGASTLALSDAGLAAVMGGGFAEGFVSEAITEKLLNEDGSINWGRCVASGIFTAVMDGVLYGTMPKGNSSPFDDFDAKTANSHQKGNFGEYKADDNMLHNEKIRDAGFHLRSIGRKAPTSLDDVIETGIDGLYENMNPNSNIRYVIDEAKFGKSQLKIVKDGRQMSDDWLLGTVTNNNRILKAVNNNVALAASIEQALDCGEVAKVLSKIDENGVVTTFLLDANGKVVGPWP